MIFIWLSLCVWCLPYTSETKKIIHEKKNRNKNGNKLWYWICWQFAAPLLRWPTCERSHRNAIHAGANGSRYKKFIAMLVVNFFYIFVNFVIYLYIIHRRHFRWGIWRSLLASDQTIGHQEQVSSHWQRKIFGRMHLLGGWARWPRVDHGARCV